MSRPRGSGRKYHAPKKISLDIEESEYRIIRQSKIPKTAIFRRGMEVCLLKLSSKELTRQLAVSYLERASLLETEASMLREKAEILLQKVGIEDEPVRKSDGTSQVGPKQTEKKLFEAFYKSPDALSYSGTAYQYAMEMINKQREMNNKVFWKEFQ